ncbi:MAG: RDD family protein [Gammaproteobacteria bacterium]|nr:MAG: RDD family protein [Gammaproteobacteria bacterium]
MTHAGNNSALEPAGLLRRLMAMFYDSLLLLSVLFLGTALALLVTGGMLDYRNPFFRAYLFGLCFLFYAWFWMHGGQTLGMRAWKLRIQRLDGGPITLRQAMLRFLYAIPCWLLVGLGYLWMLVDRDRMAVHDRLSKTVIVRLPKK